VAKLKKEKEGQRKMLRARLSRATYAKRHIFLTLPCTRIKGISTI
jgi:hypothetical protein